MSEPLNRISQAQARGEAAEASAARFLETQGLVVLERRYSRRCGEVDVICVDPATRAVVFVEVRYRHDHRFGGPVASVTPAKARRLRHTAASWLQRHADPQRPARIDVIGLSTLKTGALDAGLAASPDDHRWEGMHLQWIQAAC